MKSRAQSINKTFWYASISTAILLLGLLLLLLQTWIFDSIVNKQLLLGPNEQATEPWITPPAPLYLNFYFFNWTNPEEINDPTKKPHLDEIGPYSFREKKEKINITWNNNDTVTYRISHTWFFDEKASGRKLSDKITTINLMALFASKRLKSMNYWTKKGFSLSFAALGSHIHVTKTAKELLFDGYQDNLLDVVQSLSFLSQEKIPFTKMGFLLERNGSYTHDGVFNVATGGSGNNGELLNWNYQNFTDVYTGACGQVRGSATDLFNQKLPKTFVELFTTETCSPVRLHYEKESVIRGMDSYTYSAGENIFDNGTRVPEYRCFSTGQELPSGILNVTNCKHSEVFLSLPHFYGADPYYLDKIDGLKPDKQKHDISITIQPRVGIALDVRFRLQSNVLLEPVEYLTQFENVPRIFIPNLWFEQVYTMPEDFASLIRLLLYLPTVITIVAGVLTVLGVLGLVWVVMLNMRLRTRNYKVQQFKMSAQSQNLAEKKYKEANGL